MEFFFFIEKIYLIIVINFILCISMLLSQSIGFIHFFKLVKHLLTQF